MDLAQAYEAVVEDSKTNKDMVTPILNMYPALTDSGLGIRFGKTGEPHKFTDWGERSYLAKIGVPVAFYRKCTPELRFKMATEFHGNWGGKATVRLKNDAIRYVGSDKYSTIDNLQVMKAVLEADNTLKGQMKLKEFEIKETSFVLRAVCSDPIDVPTIGRSFRTGIQVVNSETGCSALRMQYILFEEVCTNGMISELFSKSITRIHKRTVGTSLLAFDLTSLLGNMDTFHSGIKQVLLNHANEEGDDTLKRITTDKDIPETVKKKTETLIQKYEGARIYEESVPLLLNVLSAFTEAIQDASVPRLERVRLESVAGRLLGV